VKHLIKKSLIFYALFALSNIHSQDSLNQSLQIKYIDSLSEVAKKDLIGSAELLKEITVLSQEINYTKGEIQSLMNLGTYYTNNSMIDSANYVYDKSENILKQHPDLEENLSHIYVRKATILDNQRLHYQALVYYHKANKIQLKLANKKDALDSKMKILDCHLALGQPDKVLAYSKELLQDSTIVNQANLKYKLYSKLGAAYFDKREYGQAINWWSANLKAIENSEDKGEITNLMTLIADAYRSLGNYKLALEKALEAKEILNHKPELSSYAATNALVLGKIYNSLDNPNKSILHFKNVLIQSPEDPMDIAFSYKNLAAIYKRMESWNMSADYYEKYGAIIDSLYRKGYKDMSRISEGKVQLVEEEYKNELLTRDNDFLTYKNEKQKRYLMITLFIGFCSLLFIFLSFVFYDKNNKNQKKVELLEENEKKILENHIQSREEEFLATMISVNERLNKLTTIKNNLASAIKYDNKEEIIEAEKGLGRFISSSSDLTIIKNRIESQYPGITAQIHTRFPDLSTNDMRHCLLIKLNLSIKESAQLLSVSTHAVKMARKRLKKKMNIPEDVSLKDHLNDLIV